MSVSTTLAGRPWQAGDVDPCPAEVNRRRGGKHSMQGRGRWRGGRRHPSGEVGAYLAARPAGTRGLAAGAGFGLSSLSSPFTSSMNWAMSLNCRYTEAKRT
jgi:hypothetical protein